MAWESRGGAHIFVDNSSLSIASGRLSVPRVVVALEANRENVVERVVYGAFRRGPHDAIVAAWQAAGYRVQRQGGASCGFVDNACVGNVLSSVLLGSTLGAIVLLTGGTGGSAGPISDYDVACHALMSNWNVEI